jgi:DNA topoisomerase-1
MPSAAMAARPATRPSAARAAKPAGDKPPPAPRVRRAPAPEPDPDITAPEDAAREAGLRYVSDASPGITRHRLPSGDFAYRDAKGRPVSDEAQLARIRKLAVPPAYTDVWICPRANGHIQATGRDARGRKQYRYHPAWREVRDATKYEHVVAFAEALPALRETLKKHMALPGLSREKVLATIVHLLETTLIRVGNEDYAKDNKSYGLTTLRNRHVAVQGTELRFSFKGKSGKEWRLQIKDRRVAKIVKACQELPGQDLFQYLDENKERQSVSSADVNAYLREVTGKDITAKDFRTWAGTVLASMALAEFEKFDSQAAAKRNIKAAIERTASRLGNTPTICRKCYVHPEVLDSYLAGGLLMQVKREVDAELRKELATLRPEEAAVLAFLRERLAG